MDSPFLVSDVQEKETKSLQAPSFPQPKSSTTGFPEHKKRTRISAFKKQRKTTDDEPPVPSGKTLSSRQDGLSATPSHSAAAALSDKQRIDQENNERLANMSSGEINEARSELFNGLDQNVLQMLLKRANLDEKNGPSPFDDEVQNPTPIIQVEDTSTTEITSTMPLETSKKSPRKVHFEDAPDEDDHISVPPAKPVVSTPSAQPEAVPDAGVAKPPTIPDDHVHTEECTSSKTHWPHAPVKPDLDPSDPDFLSSLHDKYFPQLPADPAKLAWMAPIPTANSPADFDSPYHPSQSSLPVSQLRFDFRGALLPPRIARAVPSTRGLHHHGEAPEAAGYTIKELARLAWSAVPGQRCISFQTLGRIFYRLGHGNFGNRGDDMPDGIWNEIMEGKVMDSLYEEAGVDPDAPIDDTAGGDGAGRGRGHRSAHAFAVEAIWLLEKGGWADKVRKG